MKIRKKSRMNGFVTALFLGAAAFLLLGSAVGSSRAALTYYSENYRAEIELTQIGVALLENDKLLGNQEENGGRLLADPAIIPKDGGIQPGKPYREELRVRNSGSIDEYVRIIIYRYWWEDAAAEENGGRKRTDLSPELIRLKLRKESGWEEDPSASTDERMVFYYTNVLPAGETSEALTDALLIDSSVLERAEKQVVSTDAGTIITLDYDFDGVRFVLEAEADAVQTHNAQDAIKSAWGVDVRLDENGGLHVTGGSGE